MSRLDIYKKQASACVHLKFVHEPVLAVGAQDRDGFITAFIEVENVKALYAEYVTAGAMFDQKLKKQAWGGTRLRRPRPRRQRYMLRRCCRLKGSLRHAQAYLRDPDFDEDSCPKSACEFRTAGDAVIPLE